MNIISDIYKDTQTPKPKPGSYEWWYFDAMADNGYSIVVIFYEGNPFSRRYIKAKHNGDQAKADQFPAISISIYKDGKPLYYSFEEVHPKNALFSDEKPSGRVGNNRFSSILTDSEITYRLELNQSVPNGDRIQADLTFKNNINGEIAASDFNRTSNQSPHTWNLVMPKCDVTGDIQISGRSEDTIQFRGTGYHDHNTGFEPMKESFTEWYWGRYHLKNQTFVYYLMNIKGSWDKQAWLISDDGEIESINQGIELQDKGLSIFGLETSRSIECKDGEHKIFIQKDRMLDNGPFYQRFEGGILFNNNGITEQGRGISEYIYPSRIYSKIFWPLVNMRIKYPDKSHWVQKSPTLYKWTW